MLLIRSRSHGGTPRRVRSVPVREAICPGQAEAAGKSPCAAACASVGWDPGHTGPENPRSHSGNTDRPARASRIPPGYRIRPGNRETHEHRGDGSQPPRDCRSEEHTSELQSLMRISYAVFCLKRNNNENTK